MFDNADDRDAREKDFGISRGGIVRPWERVVAELAKCVMLCANCHREVHAGVREIDDEALLGLAETAAGYDGAVTPVAPAASRALVA